MQTVWGGLQSLRASLDEANQRAKQAEDEMQIVQRQLERMRHAVAPGSSPSKLGAIVEENGELKDTIKHLKDQVLLFGTCLHFAM